MIECYNFDLWIIVGSLVNILSEGLLVVVFNYLFGILDGLMMGCILFEWWFGDFKVMVY